MNRILKNLLVWAIFAILFVLVAPYQAAGQAASAVFAGNGTDVGTTLNYFVVSANGRDQGVPVITFVNVTSDKSDSVLKFYSAGTPVNCTQASVQATNIVVASTNGFAAGDVIIIRYQATDNYARRVVHDVTQGTNIVTTAVLTTPTAAGDLVYKATAAGSIPVGNATLNLIGTGIYAGQRGKPLLVEVDATSACEINAIAGQFIP
jgi:hypothetical protein